MEERDDYTNYRYKAKDISPSIVWRREAETVPTGHGQSQRQHTIHRLEKTGRESAYGHEIKGHYKVGRVEERSEFTTDIRVKSQ